MKAILARKASQASAVAEFLNSHLSDFGAEGWPDIITTLEGTLIVPTTIVTTIIKIIIVDIIGATTGGIGINRRSESGASASARS